MPGHPNAPALQRELRGPPAHAHHAEHTQHISGARHISRGAPGPPAVRADPDDATSDSEGGVLHPFEPGQQDAGVAVRKAGAAVPTRALPAQGLPVLRRAERVGCGGMGQKRERAHTGVCGKP